MTRTYVKPCVVVAGLAVVMALGVIDDAQAASWTAYQAGMRIAKKRNYGNPECFAGVYAKHARQKPSEKGGTIWSAATGQAYKGELWSQCGISR